MQEGLRTENKMTASGGVTNAQEGTLVNYIIYN